jgi:2-dehydro-3-deoxy-D-arabinonate dehydratase
MKLVRFHIPEHGARIGLWVGDAIYDLSASDLPQCCCVGALLQASTETSLVALLEGIDTSALPAYAYADLDRAPVPNEPFILPPIDRQEVWAAGVTYAWSREARVREAVSKDVYVKVYEAERPELFFKSAPQKAVGPGEWVGIRGDSHWNVPEPELALVINPKMQIVGYTVGNDMSSRDIEGENPLYLPQAKVYRHSCALGPAIALAKEGFDARNLSIHMTILRGGAPAFEGETSTSKIHRDLDELAEFLGRYEDFAHGAILLTGTGIVPGDDFTLQDGDQVSITIEGIGTLTNPVKQM